MYMFIIDQLEDNLEDNGLKILRNEPGLRLMKLYELLKTRQRLHNVLFTAKLPTLQEDSTRLQLNTTWKRTAFKQHTGTVNEIHIPDNLLAS